MRQEIISYISCIKDEMYALSKYLYENPECSFQEQKAVNYLSKLLKGKDFSFQSNYFDIPTAFLASFGTGHPKICFICEYDAAEDCSHSYGNNLSTAISVTAALSLSKVLASSKGSVLLIGTPGELNGGSKTTLDKQGAFEDVDAILTLKADKFTNCDYQSNACIKFSVFFTENKNSIYTTEEALLMFMTLLSQIKTKENKLTIISYNNNQLILNIHGHYMNQIETLKLQYATILASISTLTNVKSEISLLSAPCQEITISETLNRIFLHNLKENGLIDIDNSVPECSTSGLGCISKRVPCLSAHLAIAKCPNILYPSKEFCDVTLSSEAFDIAMKAAQALAFTGLDLIEKQSLLLEINTEISK